MRTTQRIKTLSKVREKLKLRAEEEMTRGSPGFLENKMAGPDRSVEVGNRERRGEGRPTRT